MRKRSTLVRSDGELPSFELIYATEAQRLTAALALVSGSRQVAEDAVAEAFVRAYLRWPRVVFRPEEPIADEFAGRERDDPVYWPSHPSTLLAVDASTGSAFPLLTDEQIEDSPANLEAMASLGAHVDHYTVVNQRHTLIVPEPGQPEEPDPPPDGD